MTVESTTAQTISASRDTAAITSHSGSSPMKPRTTNTGHEQELVRHRVHVGAEFGALIEVARDEAVDAVGDPGEHKPGERPAHLVCQQCEDTPGTSRNLNMVIKLGNVTRRILSIRANNRRYMVETTPTRKVRGRMAATNVFAFSR